MKQEKYLQLQQLKMEYDIAKKTNNELHLQKQIYTKEFQLVNGHLDIQANTVKEAEKKNMEKLRSLNNDIEKYHQMIEEIKITLNQTQNSNDILQSQIQTKTKMIDDYIATINLLQIDKLMEEMSNQSNHVSKLEQILSNSVDDHVLYDWMVIAIRLDYIIHNRSTQSNFDRDATYLFLKHNKIPYTLWPKHILTQIIGNNRVFADNK